MTIVTGFPGKGTQTDNQIQSDRAFVVLGADSEEGAWPFKSSVEKIAVVETDGCKCLIAGAGSGIFVDLAVQEIEGALVPPLTLDGVRQSIEDVVTTIHADRISQYPQHEQADCEFELLCAIWVAGKGVQLVRVGRAYSLVRRRPESIGVGAYLASYIIATYYIPDQLNIYHTSRLVTYLLSQVKEHAMACGGVSRIVSLDDCGNIETVEPIRIAQHERSTSVAIASGAKWLLHFADPVAWGGDLNRMDSVIDRACGYVKDELRRLWTLWSAPPAAASLDPAPPTPDSSDPPPSQESGESPSPAS